MLTLLLLAQTAVPLSPERADARCVAVFGMMASDPKEEVQRAAQLGSIYFYGKLIGRNPALDLKTAMLDAARAVAANAKPELTRCGAELKASGEAMQAAGAALGGGAATPHKP